MNISGLTLINFILLVIVISVAVVVLSPQFTATESVKHNHTEAHNQKIEEKEEDTQKGDLRMLFLGRKN